MEYGTGFGYRENFISTKNITMCLKKGYGAAFPRNSKHFANINRKIMEYSENGDLERLRRFWLTGTCNPKKEEKKASEPLAPEQVW